MRAIRATLIVLLPAVLAGAAEAACSNPPQGFGSSWWQQYQRWCSQQCGGIPDVNTLSCRVSPSRSNIPSGPSPEELRRQREQQDLNEEALDDNDKGVAAYKRGDYNAAVQYLKQAHEDAPDDASIASNLRRALAAQQAASVQYHSNAARTLSQLPGGAEPSSMEARREFDTGGQAVGTVFAYPIGHKGQPVPQRVMEDKRFQALIERIKRAKTRLDALNGRIASDRANLQSATPDTTQTITQDIAKLKQQQAAEETDIKKARTEVRTSFAVDVEIAGMGSGQ